MSLFALGLIVWVLGMVGDEGFVAFMGCFIMFASLL